MTIDESFQVFWRHYPRRQAKKDALKAWQQIRPTSAQLEEMIQALAWQRNQPQWQKDNGSFIPLPASWLRAQRWEDEPFHQIDEAELARQKFIALGKRSA